MSYAYPLIKVTPLPDFKVKAVFSDGTEGIADLSWVLEIEHYKKIHDSKVFASDMKLLDDGTIEWAEDIDAGWEDIYFQITGKHPSNARPPDTRKRIELVEIRFTSPPDVYVEFSDGNSGELSLPEFATEKRRDSNSPSNIMTLEKMPWDNVVWNGIEHDTCAMYHKLTGVDIDTAEEALNR